MSSITIQDTSVKREEFDVVRNAVNKLTEVKDPVMYAFVNKSLKMNAGKVAAQVMHAQEELFTEIMEYAPEEVKQFHFACAKKNPRTVIVLETTNTDELYKIVNYLESCEIRNGIYVDERGENYLLEPTAMVTQYLDKADSRIQKIFSMFNLYYSQDYEEELTSKFAEVLRENNRLKYELDCLKDRGLFARIFNR